MVFIIKISMYNITLKAIKLKASLEIKMVVVQSDYHFSLCPALLFKVHS